MTQNVLLAYLHPNEVPASFAKSLLNLIGYDLSGEHHLASWAEVKCGSMGIPEGRNDACRALLGRPDCEWLFFVDADMGFEPFVLEALLSMADAEDRRIVGGLCFAQRETQPDGMNGFRAIPLPTIMDWVKHADGFSRFTGRVHYPANALVKAGATGCAMVLIHRSVIEEVKEEYGEVWFDRVKEQAPPHPWIGEDISFFIRCQSLGIGLHIHTGIRTTHFKHHWVGETDFWRAFDAPPATERVDVIVPVLHRPQNVKPFMESLRASTGLATAWAVVEEDDQEEADAWALNGAEVLTIPEVHTFAEKVNAAVPFTDSGLRPHFAPAPWVLLVGDDVIFRPGWLDHAQDVARRYSADVIGTNDLANARVTRGEHATHPMLRRSYIEAQGASWDGPGVVCHEGYKHWCVDDEIVAVAKQRGAFQPALGSIVEHMHPIAGKAPMDEVYEKGNKHAEADRKTFEHRVKQHADQLVAVP